MLISLQISAWFQQDGATAHTSVIARDWLNSDLETRLFRILQTSHDLSPLDFFQWNYVKEKVFSTRPSSIDNLKIAISEAFALIDQDTLSAVTANFEKRVELCIKQRGGHFEHLLQFE